MPFFAAAPKVVYVCDSSINAASKNGNAFHTTFADASPSFSVASPTGDALQTFFGTASITIDALPYSVAALSITIVVPKTTGSGLSKVVDAFYSPFDDVFLSIGDVTPFVNAL